MKKSNKLKLDFLKLSDKKKTTCMGVFEEKNWQTPLLWVLNQNFLSVRYLEIFPQMGVIRDHMGKKKIHVDKPYSRIKYQMCSLLGSNVETVSFHLPQLLNIEDRGKKK